MNFTKGGLNFFTKYEDETMGDLKMTKNRYGFYGWFGYGGSIMQWNPELKIGFAFVPTLLDQFDMFNDRGAALQKLVVDCTMYEGFEIKS